MQMPNASRCAAAVVVLAVLLLSSPARAVCPTYHYEAHEVQVTVTPKTKCLGVQFQGSLDNCKKVRVKIDNGCKSLFALAKDPGACAGQKQCQKVAAGRSVSFLVFDPDFIGAKPLHYDGTLGNDAIAIDITYKVKNMNSDPSSGGCSVAQTAGSSESGARGFGGGLLALLLGALHRVRRSRPRE